jgi:murein DD-endopeptidase MepM/ murein hydrolase activator NlpD
MPLRLFALVLVALSFLVPAFAPGARAAPVSSGVYRWPLAQPVTVTRRFEPPPDPYKAGHRGADLLGTAGAEVHSAGAGVVAFAGMVAGRPVVSVSHPGGLRTTYEPVDPSVRAGTVVAAGTPLGVLRAGHAGCPAPACLHWGLRSGEVYLDPLSLLHRGRVRLLPL